MINMNLTKKKVSKFITLENIDIAIFISIFAV